MTEGESLDVSEEAIVTGRWVFISVPLSLPLSTRRTVRVSVLPKRREGAGVGWKGKRVKTFGGVLSDGGGTSSVSPSGPTEASQTALWPRVLLKGHLVLGNQGTPGTSVAKATHHGGATAPATVTLSEEGATLRPPSDLSEYVFISPLFLQEPNLQSHQIPK